MFFILGVNKVAISIQQDYTFNEVYTVLDNNTNSIIRLSSERLLEISKKLNKKIANADIKNDLIKLHSWVKPTINSRKSLSLFDFAVIAKVDNNKYKVVDKDNKITYTNCNGIFELMLVSQTCNCRIVNNRGKQAIKFTDTINSTPKEEFKEQIDSLYRAHKAKLKLLSSEDIDFEYIIEGNRVIMTKYTGKEKEITVPDFVTHIASNCFYPDRRLRMETVMIGNGVKGIGINAFPYGKIKSHKDNDTLEYYILSGYNSTKFSVPDNVLKIYE